ncbi:protein neprosin-like [Nicotiana tomentosiformis]|uniref:protein neprosin-like n=1 Tax=Nicotiana tomentosiformis TaxID=4098 RepID=UPI00051AE57D
MYLVNQRKVVLQILMVLYVLLSYDGVQGEIKLSKVEDLELEKQLKLLNKPATKIIKTKYGDIYDCVDFYKQPAFDHPLLKNHDFHPKMKPTLARTRQNSNTSATNWSSSIWLKERGCPFGTVPIKRVIKDDLI